MKLSKRLETISKLVEKYKVGDVLADIGSDHAYLPCDVVSRGVMKKAYACDIGEGPLKSARENIKNNHLENKVIPLLGSGITPIKDKKDVSLITISGVGGTLIRDILDEYSPSLKNYRFILQANSKRQLLREYLSDQGMGIIDEEIVEDAHFIYEIMVCEYKGSSLSKEDILFGPVLRKKKDPLFIKKWERILKNQRDILNAVSSDSQKYQETCLLIEKIEGELSES